MSSALGPMIPVAFQAPCLAVPCSRWTCRWVPGRICSCISALASPDDRAGIGTFACVARAGPSLPRKEVIQPQLPLRLPCYDFVPITSPTLGRCPPANRVGPRTSGVTSFHDVTGGVYKAREHIHRPVLTGGY